MPWGPGTYGTLGQLGSARVMRRPGLPEMQIPGQVSGYPNTGFAGPMGGAGVPNMPQNPYQNDPRLGQIPQDFPPYGPQPSGDFQLQRPQQPDPRMNMFRGPDQGFNPTLAPAPGIQAGQMRGFQPRLEALGPQMGPMGGFQPPMRRRRRGF